MIRVQADGASWQTLGAERDRGILPAAPAPTWDAWGSAALNFSLARDASIPQPDLAAFTPIEYLPYGDAGGIAWGGYIMDTPAAGEAGLNVSAKGWQYALDDDPYVDAYVHENLGDWQDASSFPGSYLYEPVNGGYAAGGAVQAGTGEIVFNWPQGTVVKANSALGIVLDLGPLSRGAKAVSVDHGAPAGHSVARNVYIKGADQATGVFGGATAGTFDQGGGPFALSVGNVTTTAVYGRPYRFVIIFLYSPAGGTTTVEELYKITGIRVFTDDTYRTAAASNLKASQVWARALSKVPVLDQGVDLITGTTFVIRSYGGIRTARTARADIDQANSYHRYLTRIRPDRRLEIRQRYGYATLEANTRRPGVDWQDATVNSGEDVWNKVTITGRSGSGAELAVTRTSSDVGIYNVLDRRGRTRSKELQVAAPTDATTMAALGDAWLTRYARTPLKGTLVIVGPDALRNLAISTVPGPLGGIRAGHAGTRVGEAVLLSNLMDLDTGDRGRVAITIGGTYDEANDSATLTIDNTRDDFEALLARMSVVSSGN